ncbi:MAG: glycosyltransferase [Anaerolineales bacterium]|nr:glycosyltransferase [Anaerolineales bacterium]
MSKILFISRYPITFEGHGGYHRTYQIYHELCQAFGDDQVDILALNGNYLSPNDNKSHSTQSLYLREIQDRLALLFEIIKEKGSPYRVLKYLLTNAYPSLWSNQPARSLYENQISQKGIPKVCLIEHPAFGSVLPINQSLGIHTVACFQNFEAFDQNIEYYDNTHTLPLFVLKFIQELDILKQCKACITISKTEAGLLGGLGLNAVYHPYIPVGEIQENFFKIREERKKNNPDPNMFLIIGTATHKPTGDGIRWFLEQVTTHGLPEQIQIIICGRGTEDLIRQPEQIPGITVKGWVENIELSELLLRANSVLVPQATGFGALTKITDMACAGLTILTSTHPTYAIEIPPSSITIENDWNHWTRKINELSLIPSQESTSYDEWYESHPRNLIPLIEKLL